MALGMRQLAAYQDTVAVYKPTKPAGTSTIGAVKEPLYTLVTASLQCRYFPNSDTSIISAIGRNESGAKPELESIHCEDGSDVKDMYKIKLLTTGHPKINTWFTVIGDPEVRPSGGNRAPNYLKANLRGTNAPTLAA